MTKPQATAPDTVHAEKNALLAVLPQVLAPLARLCMAKGLSVQAVEEALRQASVEVAAQTCDAQQAARSTSRISAMTGLPRREVDRIQAQQAPARPPVRSPAADVLTYWVTQAAYLNRKRQPITLARTGAAPSFEALASSVTRDVHPKTILAEMLRLGLATHDLERDTVTLNHSSFVPKPDWPQMVGFLGSNVGDHLQASVDNLLGDGSQHFEQALLADELSAQSLHSAKALISEQWRSLMTQLGPQLQALMEDDQRSGRTQDQQLRIGLYSYMQPMPPAPQQPAAPAAAPDRKRNPQTQPQKDNTES